MADNIIAPAVGAILATDDVSGVQYPRNKISFGADGSATDVSDADPFPIKANDLQAASYDFDISPHDTNALAFTPRSIYVGGAGDLTVRLPNSASDRLYKAVPVGMVLPISPSHVRATGTTATYLVGMGKLGGDD